MNRLRIALTVLLLAAPRGAHAFFPDPRFSTISGSVRVCPAGDLAQVGTIRDVSNAPLSGVTVCYAFCTCTSVRTCSTIPGDTYAVNGCQVTTLTNAGGGFTMAPRAGGVCGNLVEITANGITMANVRWVRSPDQDGSGNVDATDAAILATKVGTADQTGDLDLDGDVDANDAAVLTVHLGHVCEGMVPAGGTSWGRIRETYR